MVLKETLRSEFVKCVIESENVKKYCKGKHSLDLNKLLVLDDLSMEVLKEIVKPSELTEMGFIGTQKVGVAIQPLPIHLIYCISPTDENFKHIEKTLLPFVSSFITIHMFSFGPINDRFIESLKSKPEIIAKLQTLLELPLTYMVQTSDLFTFGPNMTISGLYGTTPNEQRICEISSKLTDLFVVMNDAPAVRYYKHSDLASKVATTLDRAVHSVLSRRPNLGRSGSQKRQSLCIILDRNVDTISPLIHDLTLEAMAHDLLEFKEHVCIVKEEGQTFSVDFDEADPLWRRFRLKHIASVSSEIATGTREFAQKHNVKLPEGEVTVAALRKQMAKLPTVMPEFVKLQSYVAMASKLMALYETNKLNQLTVAEQEFGTNSREDGSPITDNFALYYNLLESATSVNDKLRLVLLFALRTNNGLSQPLAEKLIKSAGIENPTQIINALKLINFPIVEGSNTSKAPLLRTEEDPDILTGYAHSRFVPYIWQICKNLISQSLDESNFPFVGERLVFDLSDNTSKKGFEFGKYTIKSDSSSKRNNPRLYIIVIGGVTYAELRCIRQSQTLNPNFDIILGSTQVITAKEFISELKSIKV